MRLMKDLRANAERKTISTREGDEITYDEYVAGCSKPFIDEIDQRIAKKFQLTDEELDSVINYDIKYRMGQNSTDNGTDEEDD